VAGSRRIAYNSGLMAKKGVKRGKAAAKKSGHANGADVLFNSAPTEVRHSADSSCAHEP
jgi:hypothetical protein